MAQQWLLVLFLACTLPVSSSPVAITNSLSLGPNHGDPIQMTQKIANLSMDGIPMDFKLLLSMGPLQPGLLPKQAYYYGAIKAAEILALEDFDGVTGKRVFTTTKYPQLRVETSTSPEIPHIPRKYVIWGLMLSCGLMDQVSGFGMVFYTLQWKGREVGGLAYTIVNQPQLSSESRSNITEETEDTDVVLSNSYTATYSATLSGNSTSQSGLTVPSNSGLVSATFMRHGGPLKEDNIFMCILMALASAAKMPNHQRITNFWYSKMDDYDSEIVTNQQPPSRSQRPYYTFESFIKSMGLYGSYFVTEERFFETAMMTMVDDVPIAITVLRHVRTELDHAEVSTA